MEMCACGKPLHYRSAATEQMVRELIASCGDYVVVHYAWRCWRVPRHYIALHGLRARDLPSLGFEEVSSTLSQ